MEQVSRDNNLKIPKELEVTISRMNTIDDTFEVKKALAKADDERFNAKRILDEVEREDKQLEVVSKLPFNANDLMVITVVKKLCAYIIAITEKSPKKFRGVFVIRMQNYCLDTLEYLLKANFIRVDSLENKREREELQKDAIIKLKLLGYISMVAENSGCILKRQYRQISLQVTEAINLTTAWRKSDDERWRRRKD